MQNAFPSHFERLSNLLLGALKPPPGRGRIAVAVIYGATCHLIFGAAVLAMISAMFFGMSKSLGQIEAGWSWLANAALLLQFPLAHSVLLSPFGRRLLSKLAPSPYGQTLGTTTYAIIASAQLLLLFALWTPSGVIWWRAEGWAFWLLCTLYAGSWLLLMKASFDAGAEVQSGALGWLSLVQNVQPLFPDMPTTGLFRLIRQPIYVAFALTLWTVPVWTPDQLAIAVTYTAYCLLAPRLKERRFKRMYGERFERYKAQTPYALPSLGVGRRQGVQSQPDCGQSNAAEMGCPGSITRSRVIDPS
ncbi:MAG: isoprenylcysteine carboxylmethyltransferase family protein [Pseudomonadota bacterium]